MICAVRWRRGGSSRLARIRRRRRAMRCRRRSSRRCTFDVLSRRGIQGVAVSEAEIRAAQRWAAEKLRLVVEPGGAVALAALLAGKVDRCQGRWLSCRAVMLTSAALWRRAGRARIMEGYFWALGGVAQAMSALAPAISMLRSVRTDHRGHSIFW